MTPPDKDLVLSFESVSLTKRPIEGGEFRILDDLSFSVAKGEFVSLVGPSGCGKTSTLRLAAGFDEICVGKLSCHLRDARGLERNPVMVFQRDTVFDWMTVEGNLTFVLDQNRAGSDSSVAVEELLQLTELIRFRRFYPRELSGGMRKRLELARGWITGATLLLLDEPMAQLDAITRLDMQLMLQELWLNEPRTILLVTHSIEESILLSDRILVMEGPPGRIRRDLPVPFSRPRTSDLRFDPRFQQLRRDVHDQLVRSFRNDAP